MSRSPEMATRRTELLQWIADRATHLLREYGVDELKAEQCAFALADDIASECGGQVISFPKNYHFKLAQRDREMLEAHRAGESAQSLACRYGMTRRAVHGIIKRAADRDPHHLQPQLF